MDTVEHGTNTVMSPSPAQGQEVLVHAWRGCRTGRMLEEGELVMAAYLPHDWAGRSRSGVYFAGAGGGGTWNQNGTATITTTGSGGSGT